jgi:hypothetical protein
MINAALKAIETMKFEGTKNEADFDFAVRKYRAPGTADAYDFQVAIYGTGFEASRNLTRDDLLTIREWIDVALAVSAPKSVAA